MHIPVLDVVPLELVAGDIHLVAEEEIELCEGGEVEVETVPDQAEQ